MRQPGVYTPYEMQNWPTSEEFAPGVYRASRPLNYMWSFRPSLYVAWQVFLGRWDALKWDSSQGYERSRAETLEND